MFNFFNNYPSCKYTICKVFCPAFTWSNQTNSKLMFLLQFDNKTFAYEQCKQIEMLQQCKNSLWGFFFNNNRIILIERLNKTGLSR